MSSLHVHPFELRVHYIITYVLHVDIRHFTMPHTPFNGKVKTVIDGGPAVK